MRLLTGASMFALHAEPAIGLRRIVFSDGPAGARGESWDERVTSANLPSPTALAASWDEAAVEAVSDLLAVEARRLGVDVLLAPTVNLHRTPYGGRHFECFSEDPYLSGRIGAAVVRGLQRRGVGATVKHFVANDSESERMTLDAVIDERTLRELYLAAFEEVVRDAGPWAVMAAYNSVNGSPMTEHPMLDGVLKNEWGFDGLVMSDWRATRSTTASASAGLDLVMPGPAGPWGDALVAAVRAGEVPVHTIDDKVLRLLRLAARVGALEPGPSPNGGDLSPAVRSARLRDAAVNGFVLLRNAPVDDRDVDGGPMLPLDVRPGGRLAVIGPHAAIGRTLGGGSATVTPPYVVSPLDGLLAALDGRVHVVEAFGAASSDRVPPAATEFLTRPDDGAPGVHLRTFDSAGEPLSDETRGSAAFTWLGGFPPGGQDVEVVELRTRLLLSPGGWDIAVAALGRVELAVDGATVLAAQLDMPAGVDPIEAVMRPPQRVVPIGVGGAGVDVVVRLHPREVAHSTNPSRVLQLGARPRRDTDTDLDRAVELAASADAVVVVVGTTEHDESEGFDRSTLVLPGRQDELVRRVAAVNAHTAVVVNAGAPVLLPWADDVPAVLMAWFPGQEFGNALADVLTGRREPAGRLPTSWPATEHGLPGTAPSAEGRLVYGESLGVGYRAGTAAQFAFGHGLGYTTWELAGAELVAPDRLELAVAVRNTGPRAGRQVIQVYAGRTSSQVSRPARWLVGFAPVDAAAGATATVRVPVAERALMHWDVDRPGWALEPGPFRIDVGFSVTDLPATLTWDPRGDRP